MTIENGLAIAHYFSLFFNDPMWLPTSPTRLCVSPQLFLAQFAGFGAIGAKGDLARADNMSQELMEHLEPTKAFLASVQGTAAHKSCSDYQVAALQRICMTPFHACGNPKQKNMNFLKHCLHFFEQFSVLRYSSSHFFL